MADPFPKSTEVCTEVGSTLQNEEWRLKTKNQRKHVSFEDALQSFFSDVDLCVLILRIHVTEASFSDIRYIYIYIFTHSVLKLQNHNDYINPTPASRRCSLVDSCCWDCTNPIYRTNPNIIPRLWAKTLAFWWAQEPIIKRPDNPTCQLLPIAQNSCENGMGKAGKRPRRWWKTDCVKELCSDNVVCERI